MRGPSRVRALVAVAVAELRHERLQTGIAVLGVAMAVLAAVLLAGVGIGVLEFGKGKFQQSGQDLWVAGGPMELRPGTVGGFQNSVVDSHGVAASIEEHDSVVAAVPLLFQTVYAGRNATDFQTVMGVGSPGGGGMVSISEGRGFRGGDTHYANGTYDGPMTREVIIDGRTADLLGVGVNDTIHLGGTIATARRNEFTVVGISPTFSRFVGAPTVVVRHSELQELTGARGSDRASVILVRVTEGADVTALQSDLSESHPRYTVRTNDEQLRATLRDKAVVLFSGASLFVLAVVAGFLLVLNMQLSFVIRHRETFAAVAAVGVSRSSLAWIVLVHALFVGVLGGLLGVGLAVPGIELVNALTAWVTGFENVAKLPRRVFLGGFALAVLVSAAGGLAATVYLARVNPLDNLQ
jgi:putative ABC transport system permease protein